MYVGDSTHLNRDAPAVTMAGSGQSETYSELEAASNRFAHLFRARGLTAGDHVSLLIDNRTVFFDVALAAHRSGLHYTAVSTHLTPAEVGYIVTDSNSRALIAAGALAELARQVPGTEALIRISVDGEIDGFESFAALRETLPSTKLTDETAGSPMLYSSGTTGRPKGVEFPLSGEHPRVLDSFTAEFIDQFGIDRDTVLLLPGPLYHTSPLFYANMVLRVGGRLIVLERFDAETTLRTIERYGVTHSFFVPTMLIRMLRLPDGIRHRYRLNTHVWSLTGAAPCPPEVKQSIAAWWGPILWEGYAGSERNGMTILTPEEAVIRPASAGRPIGCGVEIVGPDGAELPVGETGLVYFTGGHQFEYHNDPDKTAAAYLRPHVSTLGDIGHVDGEGFLYLTDRSANVIIAGGVNVYPQEAEAVLALHPAVEDIAVIGVPDPDLGEAPHAIVVPRAPAPPSDELANELIDHCRSRLARYKCPRTVEFVDRLPRLPNGKLVKHSLSANAQSTPTPKG